MLQTFNILRCELSRNSSLYQNIQELQDAINEDNVTNINNLALATSLLKQKLFYPMISVLPPLNQKIKNPEHTLQLKVLTKKLQLGPSGTNLESER